MECKAETNGSKVDKSCGNPGGKLRNLLPAMS